MANNFESVKVPKMLTVNECAELTNLAKYHIRRLIHENKVKFILSGTKYLVNFDSLVEYLNIGETKLGTEGQSVNVDKIKKVEV